MRFAEILSNDGRYKVPIVIPEWTTDRIIATEFVKGVDLEELAEAGSQDLRDEVGHRVLELTIREIF